MSYFAENAIHYPIDACGRDAGTCTFIKSLKVSYHLFYERQLDVCGIGDRNFLSALTGLQYNGRVGEYGKAYTSLLSDKFYLVCPGTLVSYETPTATAR